MAGSCSDWIHAHWLLSRAYFRSDPIFTSSRLQQSLAERNSLFWNRELFSTSNEDSHRLSCTVEGNCASFPWTTLGNYASFPWTTLTPSETGWRSASGAIITEMLWLLAYIEWFMDPLHMQLGCPSWTWKTKSKFAWRKHFGWKFWLVLTDAAEVMYSDKKRPGAIQMTVGEPCCSDVSFHQCPGDWIIASTGHWLDPAWQIWCY